MKTIFFFSALALFVKNPGTDIAMNNADETKVRTNRFRGMSNLQIWIEIMNLRAIKAVA